MSDVFPVTELAAPKNSMKINLLIPSSLHLVQALFFLSKPTDS